MVFSGNNFPVTVFRQQFRVLRDWLEDLDSDDRNKYILRFVALFVLCALLVICHYCLSRRLEFYRHTSRQINHALQNSEQKLQVMQHLQAAQSSVNFRLNALSKLQGQRLYAGQLFLELANLFPDTVILTRLALRNNILTLDGRTKSHTAVADLMQALGRSMLFTQPTLVSIRQQGEKNDGEEFAITLGCNFQALDGQV